MTTPIDMVPRCSPADPMAGVLEHLGHGTSTYTTRPMLGVIDGDGHDDGDDDGVGDDGEGVLCWCEHWLYTRGGCAARHNTHYPVPRFGAR